jgi:hypothetical protein
LMSSTAVNTVTSFGGRHGELALHWINWLHHPQPVTAL